MGDFRLSPAYDLLNTRIHINDSDFALDDGLLPKNLAKGKMVEQFQLLAEQAEIGQAQVDTVLSKLLSNSEKVFALIGASYLGDRAKKNSTILSNEI